MNETQLFQLSAQIDRINHSAKKSHRLDSRDIERAIETLEAHKDDLNAKKIRVYSRTGFVARSYKWQIMIAYIEFWRDADTGEWKFGADVCDAKRSHGQGALITINGKAA